ncbi:MAG: hypothetical protein FWC84_03380 [Alphaproteobacteria bacterium]|nr:hypothetical protein [Alphaproteobacteria bacterium]
MTRSGILLATMFGAALVASGPASAAEVACMYNGGMHPCVYYPGYPYAYGNPNGNGIGSDLEGIVTAPFALATEPLSLATAPLAQTETAPPLMTGRSVAVSGPASAPEAGGVAGPGNYCATSVKTCALREPGWLGTGCSCKVPGGYARGFVK